MERFCKTVFLGKMFTEWIERKSENAVVSAFGSDKMKDCIVAPIHMISDDIHDNQELDFMLKPNTIIYLLRIK